MCKACWLPLYSPSPCSWESMATFPKPRHSQELALTQLLPMTILYGLMNWAPGETPLTLSSHCQKKAQRSNRHAQAATFKRPSTAMIKDMVLLAKQEIMQEIQRAHFAPVFQNHTGSQRLEILLSKREDCSVNPLQITWDHRMLEVKGSWGSSTSTSASNCFSILSRWPFSQEGEPTAVPLLDSSLKWKESPSWLASTYPLSVSALGSI